MDKLTRRALAYADRYVRGWCQDFDIPEHARDDALQEARVEALKRARTFDDMRGQMLEEWIRARLEPRLFRWLKRQHHGGITGTSEAQAPVGVFNATIEEPQDVEPIDDLEKLLTNVGNLAPEERRLLEEYYGLSGPAKTHEHLADERGITRRGIGKRIERILEKIYPELVPKIGIGGNPYRGDEAQAESPSTEQAALGGGASYTSLEYKHLKKQFQKLCEDSGYSESAAPAVHGLHDEQTGPGTLSTKCSEWVPDSKFWTPPRNKARRDAAIRFANERREFRMHNRQEDERLVTALAEQSEAPGGEHAAEFFLRQAQRSPRYEGLLLGNLEGIDEGTDE